MGKVLTPEQVAGYDRDGYHFPISLLSAEEVARYRAAYEAAEKVQDGEYAGALRSKPHLLFTWAHELVTHPKVLDAVEDLLGPNLLCWSANFFTKEPHTEDYVSWHQDATYWGLSEADVITAWIALSPATVESGCMRFVAGTHHEQVQHQDTFADQNLLSRGQEIAVDVREEDAFDVVLQPGEMSLHHVLLFHASWANQSDDRRIGFAIRYIPTHLKQVAGPGDAAMLVRGEDTYGHFELEPPPERDLDPKMIALHRDIGERQAAILYRGTDRNPYT